tara:strand:+ start:715 stop:822 length:108 start_codon:yes stop_codon:yes gene_type:complete
VILAFVNLVAGRDIAAIAIILMMRQGGEIDRKRIG